MLAAQIVQMAACAIVAPYATVRAVVIPTAAALKWGMLAGNKGLSLDVRSAHRSKMNGSSYTPQLSAIKPAAAIRNETG
jgi:hypothetical protein